MTNKDIAKGFGTSLRGVYRHFTKEKENDR